MNRMIGVWLNHSDSLSDAANQQEQTGMLNIEWIAIRVGNGLGGFDRAQCCGDVAASLQGFRHVHPDPLAAPPPMPKKSDKPSPVQPVVNQVEQQRLREPRLLQYCEGVMVSEVDLHWGKVVMSQDQISVPRV